MEKPKLMYAEFVAAQQMKQQREGTLSWAIERYRTDMSQPGMKPLGESQDYALGAIQRDRIGAKLVPELEQHDFVDFAKRRRQKVQAPTVNHDLSDIRVVLKHGRSSWKGCKEFTKALTELEDARYILVKLGLISKSKRRTRRPTDAEITALLEYYETPVLRGKQRTIRMPEIIAFALVSTRRLGEICRITYGDINWEKKTYWVRDLKHSTKKKGNDKEFALFPELAIIIKRQPRLTDNPNERIFPFNARSCSASYQVAKKRLGIDGLTFHDNRGEAISRWLLKGLSKDQVRKLLSGHETTKMIDEVYDRRVTSEIMVGVEHLLEQPPQEERPAA